MNTHRGRPPKCIDTVIVCAIPMYFTNTKTGTRLEYSGQCNAHVQETGGVVSVFCTLIAMPLDSEVGAPTIPSMIQGSINLDRWAQRGETPITITGGKRRTLGDEDSRDLLQAIKLEKLEGEGGAFSPAAVMAVACVLDEAVNRAGNELAKVLDGMSERPVLRKPEGMDPNLN